MNRKFFPVGKLAIALCGALLGFSTHAQPSVAVGVVVLVTSVEIHTESDFYEPLTPSGEWVVVGSYGRCWRPAHVASDWRPYSNGNWELTDEGWYWVSDEPWAWATYHYGRWDFTDDYGWYWVPQTQWAPAWVSWHEGGGYVGWAPLQPSVRVTVRGYVGFNQSRVSPRAFVFVKQGQFLDPIRPTTVVVSSTKIINQTSVISNTKLVNNAVFNGGPPTRDIEKSSGRKVAQVPVRELRQKQEEAVITRQRTTSVTGDKKVTAPVPAEVEPRGKKNSAVTELPKVEKPAAVKDEVEKPARKNQEVPIEKQSPVRVAPDLKPDARPEVNNRPPQIKETAPPEAEKRIEPQMERPARASDDKVQPPVRGNPDAGERGRPNPPDKADDKRPKE